MVVQVAKVIKKEIRPITCNDPISKSLIEYLILTKGV